jgi:RNA polymerase sigma-70 factor (ECF subfamily)
MMYNELIPHLFRIEFRKITAVLCKTFGLAHMEIAADIASDTFLSALETWPYKGIPDNPTAWLYYRCQKQSKEPAQPQQEFQRQGCWPPVSRNAIPY